MSTTISPSTASLRASARLRLIVNIYHPLREIDSATSNTAAGDISEDPDCDSEDNPGKAWLLGPREAEDSSTTFIERSSRCPALCDVQFGMDHQANVEEEPATTYSCINQKW